jgi:lipoprotein-releasing system ATP-binding protein
LGDIWLLQQAYSYFVANMSKPQPIIRTVNLRKTYKGVVDYQALKGVDIEVDQGSFVSIVGQSGSGKSTLLYVMSTLDTSYEGEIYFNNLLLRKMSRNQISALRNKDIGFVFQFHYLLPEFSVVDNVSLPALKLGKYNAKQIRERAIEKLDLLGLADQADKKASQLSGGQQQRVAIARALINDPLVIFGDEPTGNLDSANAEMVFEIFRKLSNQDGKTVIIVTHDNDLAAKTDMIIRLKDGLVLNW